MYQVLAPKWRPQTFDDLVGQKHVAQTLVNAIQADRLAHAYIFAGLRGTGKTTVARILSKCLNCAKGPTADPCGECDACREIAESRSMDVLEIDAASRTKVEQTRELLEVVSYAPARDRYKVLIVDEAHMLSKASFNALLKTLEEPPPNVVFLLATTELQRILPTILSRCQVFEFRRVSPAEVAAQLRRICDDEGAQVSDSTLERIARAGEGSVRDSLSVLERVFAFCGMQIDDGDVLRMLGGVRAETLGALLAGLTARDAAAMLTVLDGLVDEGHDLVHFWSEAIGALRDVMLMRTVTNRDDLLTRSPDEAHVLLDAAAGLSLPDLSRAFNLLADLEPGLRSSSQPRFLFEAALIRLASLGAVTPIEQLLREGPAADPPPARQAPPQKKKLIADPPKPVTARAPGAFDTERFVEAVREKRPMLAAVLEQAEQVEVEHGRLRVRFADGMDALGRRLDQPASATVLQEVLRELTGAGPATGAATTAATTTKKKPRIEKPAAEAKGRKGGLLDEVKRDPGVKRLLDTFDARVLDVRRPDEEIP